MKITLDPPSQFDSQYSSGRDSRKDRSNIGFMNDNQRLNVALTRAKYGLWIVGDVSTMSASGRESSSIWRDLVVHCQQKGYVRMYVDLWIFSVLCLFVFFAC